MNIQEAKEQIKYAIAAYLTKNEQNEYLIPIQAQRPLFIMGAPGIGKTDIMKQVAEELSIGMVSYSMTHHTRQSALGLPYICEKSYKGEKYQVSEYTMSEILSTIYDVVEEDGVSEGILFLDEINCVSETLAPSMLQFLQFKTFGKHKVPDGWVVVTAGNPPEYNNSVREFDIVTWDRLKRVDVEPDFQTWINHAKINGVHPAILSYLELKQYDFYKVETSVDGKCFVTARGWVDLSQMIRIFEEKGFPVDETLVAQYLQNKDTAKNFAVYYDLFQKYRSDYEIFEILAGTNSNVVAERAKNAEFDEQLALITLLIEALTKGMREVSRMDKWGIAF
ncbi:MAG: AAA family ATPase, partial [Eubacteriales bacterium]